MKLFLSSLLCLIYMLVVFFLFLATEIVGSNYNIQHHDKNYSEKFYMLNLGNVEE